MNPEQDTRELFERYADMVYRIAVSSGLSVHLAQDIVQEVFLRYLKKQPRFENSAHEKAWFIRVALNRCKSMASSAWYRRTCPLEEARPLESAAQDAPLQPEDHALYEALSGLAPKYRTVLYLRYYEEYQVQEIATLLGITPNLVSARLSRARKLLRKQLSTENERKGYQHETGTI